MGNICPIWHIVQVLRRRNGGVDIEKFIEKQHSLVVHLRKSKNILIQHLKIEDELLYPALLKSKNKEIRETTEKFAAEMKQISEKTMSFFDKYAKLKVEDLSANDDFRDDLDMIIAIIKKRIAVEEADLYPLYTKLNPSEKAVSRNRSFVFL